MNENDKIADGRNLLRLAILAALAVILIGTGLTGPAKANEPLVLRERIEVQGDVVTLGDMFENSGDKARVAVFRAPELGTSGVVAAERVAAAAERHGLEWPNPGGIDEVAVRRPGRLISLEEMRKAIASHAARGDDGKWIVDFNRGTKPFYIDSRITAPLEVKQLDTGTEGGAFRATLTARHDRFSLKGEIVTGQAYPAVEAIVPAHNIRRGTTINRNDLKVVDMPRAKVSNTAIEDMKTAIGMSARQRLTADRPIRRDQLEFPKLVKRNTLVTITYAVPGMVLKAKGRAMDDASKGQSVQVVNLQSKRTIEAEVTGTGAVSVIALQPPRPARRTAASQAGATNAYVR